jgi:hypothetical protein
VQGGASLKGVGRDQEALDFGWRFVAMKAESDRPEEAF